MVDADIAWATGLIEGEGCFYTFRCRQGPYLYLYPRMQVNMTDEDPLQRLRAILGGALNGPYVKTTPSRANRKVQWHWSVNNPAEFDRIADLIRPWLCARRRGKLAEVQAEVRGRAIR